MCVSMSYWQLMYCTIRLPSVSLLHDFIQGRQSVVEGRGVATPIEFWIEQSGGFNPS